MAYDYLGLINDVNRRLNEVELTTSNFATATGEYGMIKDAVKALYNENSININTARTVYGKKAFVQFETVEKARDLATKIGML